MSHAPRSSKVGRVVALLLVVAAATSLTGCTARQSRDQYEERLAQAVAVRQEVSSQLDDGTLKEPAQFEAAASKVQSSLEDLDADPAPRGLDAAHDSMISALDGLGALLGRLGRCARLSDTSEQDARACRQSISQDVYDQIRNDFREADTIYREEGLSVPGLGASEDDGTSTGSDVLGGGKGDEL